MVPGTEVGAYRVLEQLGAGGMGAVWLAEHKMLGRRAAIKVLHPAFSSQADVVTRFFNEARAATAIADPGIVQIFDFGHHTDGSAYIVMELLDGEALDQRLKRLGTLPVGDAVRLIRQVASSLGAAHVRNIVHRDLKPENLYVVRDPEVPGGERAKILDFGIAKLLGDGGGQTQNSAVIGTPVYMSPEQCRGAGAVDQRSDVYSLGCVLFTLICGRPPFLAAGMGELLALHMFAEPPMLSSRVAGVPAEVERLVLRCMAKAPEERFGSAGELAAALDAILAGVAGMGRARAVSVGGARAAGALGASTTLSTAASATVGSSSVVPGAAASSASVPAPRARSRAGGLGVVAGLIVVGGGVAWLASRGSSSSSSSSSSSPGGVESVAAPRAAAPTPDRPAVDGEVPSPAEPSGTADALASWQLGAALTSLARTAPAAPVAPPTPVAAPTVAAKRRPGAEPGPARPSAAAGTPVVSPSAPAVAAPVATVPVATPTEPATKPAVKPAAASGTAVDADGIPLSR